MNKKPLYVHLEGMDLAGKTTARVTLFRSLGPDCRFRHNSLCDTNPIYELADRLRKKDSVSEETLGHLYVAALKNDLDRFCSPETHTIQDSTIVLRSLAYHMKLGTPFVVDTMMKLLPQHPRFTKSFVLTASLRVRRQRLRQRQLEFPSEIAPDDLQILRCPERFLAMEATLIDLAQRYFNAVVIDTSDLNPSDVRNAIIRELPQLG